MGDKGLKQYSILGGDLLCHPAAILAELHDIFVRTLHESKRSVLCEYNLKLSFCFVSLFAYI